MSANSGHVIGTISEVALSFIVHDPSGIIVRSSARSRSAEATQVAQHLVLAVVAIEDRLGEEVVGSPAGDGEAVGDLVELCRLDRRAAEGTDDRGDVTDGGGLVERDGHGRVVDAPDVEAGTERCGDGGVSGRHRQAQRVEPRCVAHLDAAGSEPGGERST